MMTDEQNIQDVECVLAGHPGLIAEFRAACAALFEDDLCSFLQQSGDAKAIKTYNFYAEELDCVLGPDAVARIDREEWQYFASRESTRDLEVWRIYSSGTPAEKEALQAEIEEDFQKVRAAMDFWGCKEVKGKYCTVRAGSSGYTEEADISYRMDYAENFYGVKP
jgi:hypothetical protein